MGEQDMESNGHIGSEGCLGVVHEICGANLRERGRESRMGRVTWGVGGGLDDGVEAVASDCIVGPVWGCAVVYV